MDGFDNLRITGFDQHRPPRLGSDSDYVGLFFELSEKAPPHWCQQFNRIIDESDRQAFVNVAEGQFIETRAQPDDIEDQLTFLKECVVRCNEEYHETLAMRKDEKQREAMVKKKKQEHLDAIIQKLRFD